jgi:hypothetical protein
MKVVFFFNHAEKNKSRSFKKNYSLKFCCLDRLKIVLVFEMSLISFLVVFLVKTD